MRMAPAVTDLSKRNEPATGHMDRPVRHERLRFYLAGALAILFGLFCHRCLASVVEHLGIATWIHFDHPVTQPILLGEVGTPSQRWSTVTLTDDFTDTNVFLTILSAVLAYYFARVCYRLDVATVMNRRARWLLGGWVVGTAVMIAISQGLGVVARCLPWLVSSYWVAGWVGLVVWAGSANLFATAWGKVMRWRGVPEAGHD
ncbi:hypothetical protein LMG22931_05036 [Paraburkholderia nemoris]|nr:hypothetical protein LMG22931_05036 [Paraburkholderia nemoris]